MGEAWTCPRRSSRQAGPPVKQPTQAGFDPAPHGRGDKPGQRAGPALRARGCFRQRPHQDRPTAAAVTCSVADTAASVTRELRCSSGSCSHVALRTSGPWSSGSELRGRGGTVHSCRVSRALSQLLESCISAAFAAFSALCPTGGIAGPWAYSTKLVSS